MVSVGSANLLPGSVWGAANVVNYGKEKIMLLIMHRGR